MKLLSKILTRHLKLLMTFLTIFHLVSKFVWLQSLVGLLEGEPTPRVALCVLSLMSSLLYLPPIPNSSGDQPPLLDKRVCKIVLDDDEVMTG